MIDIICWKQYISTVSATNLYFCFLHISIFNMYHWNSLQPSSTGCKRSPCFQIQG